MNHYSVIKATLEAKLKELMQRAADIEARLSSPGSADWEENATESEDDEVLSSVGSMTKNEIQEIKLALNRIENGHYGKCTSCGEPIAKARLEDLPYATRCVRCA
ncbi:MAG: TraR/DksA family transcriptional regulator [Planctomycetaceae bacterium]|nr:TraR/DksA family transcriptional regulator [Planctomycetaceae bacterium]